MNLCLVLWILQNCSCHLHQRHSLKMNTCDNSSSFIGFMIHAAVWPNGKMWIRLTIKLPLPRLRHLDSGALKLDLVIYYTLRSGKSPCRISHCFLVSIIITLDWNYVAKDKSSKLLTWITLAQHAIYCLDSPMWQFETEWGLQLLKLNMDYTKMLVRGHSVDSENKVRSRSASSHNDKSVKATSSMIVDL
jgi:hypothetical protein